MIEIAEYVTVENLSEDMRSVAEVVGVPKTVELVGYLGGTLIYFPKTLVRKEVFLKFMQEHPTMSVSEASKALGIANQTCYNYLS